MDARFLRLYEDELAHIRQTAGEFAQQFPKIGGRLRLDAEGKNICEDPFVERLLEGFAFLTARVQLKFESEFPTFTQALLDTVYPHYLCPLPSMTVVRFEPDLAEGGALAAGHVIPRGIALQSHPAGSSSTSCEFRTAHEVTLWPLRVREARYVTSRELGTLELPEGLEAKAAVQVRLELPEGVTFAQLLAKRLVFHLRGNAEVPVALYENLFARFAGAFGGFKRDGRLWRMRLPDSSLRPRGFEEGDALLPPGPRTFDGYRLLQEYFALPSRFQFFEIGGLKPVFDAAGAAESVELIFTFKEDDPRLEGKVDAGCFELYCTPAINLFERRCDRVQIDPLTHEHPVLPDRTRTLDYEVYQLSKVTGLGARAEEEQPFEPFFHASDDGSQRAFYTVRRQTRMLTTRERELGANHEYPGAELWISLVDGNHAPHSPNLRQLAISAYCTNRHLPMEMPVGIGTTDFSLDSGAPVKSIRCVGRPTKPRGSHALGESTWRLISHLSLNYLSLVDHDAVRGAVALRELLKLYTDTNDNALRKHVDGVRSVRAEPIVRQVERSGPVTFARGLQLTLLLRESDFKGTGAFLLGAVLDRFFAKYTSLNSFTETVVATEERGEIVRWPTRLGTREQL